MIFFSFKSSPLVYLHYSWGSFLILFIVSCFFQSKWKEEEVIRRLSEKVDFCVAWVHVGESNSLTFCLRISYFEFGCEKSKPDQCILTWAPVLPGPCCRWSWKNREFHVACFQAGSLCWGSQYLGHWGRCEEENFQVLLLCTPQIPRLKQSPRLLATSLLDSVLMCHREKREKQKITLGDLSPRRERGARGGEFEISKCFGQ